MQINSINMTGLPARLYAQSKVFLSSNLYKYNRLPTPLLPIYVSPDNVSRFTSRTWPPWKNKKHHLGTIAGGNWDKTEPEIRDGYGTMYELFRAEKFSDSVFYQSLH